MATNTTKTSGAKTTSTAKATPAERAALWLASARAMIARVISTAERIADDADAGGKFAGAVDAKLLRSAAGALSDAESRLSDVVPEVETLADPFA